MTRRMDVVRLVRKPRPLWLLSIVHRQTLDPGVSAISGMVKRRLGGRKGLELGRLVSHLRTI